MEYQFTLKFKLAAEDAADDTLKQRLAEAGCADAMVGVGMAGDLGLSFQRAADTAQIALLTALTDVKMALPKARLIEVGPDLVGLAEAAELLGLSRHELRKWFLDNASEFPSPVHSGESMIWHLAHVIEFLKVREYPLPPSLLDLSLMTMRVNIAKQRSLLDSVTQDGVGKLLQELIEELLP